MKITAIKTKKGYYITAKINNLDKLFINGYLPIETFHKDWFFVKKEPETLERSITQKATNYRYELIDTTMVTDKIKKMFLREDVAKYDTKFYEWFWKKEYAHLASLYDLKYDKQPNIKESLPFELDVIMELEEIKDHNSFSYKIAKSSFEHEGTMTLTEKNIRHQLFDAIIFPSILLPTKVCKLTSIQTYEIVRQHIKDNINPKNAEITSDYDFCFTVKKRIALNIPKKFTVDVNNNIFSKRKRKPKYVTKYQTHRHVEIFEMTNDIKKYEGYSIIKGFEGKDQTDLKEKIDFYLKHLVEFINEPLKDCPTCKGLGVIINQQPETNFRKETK